jgi:hypothetical protein
MLKLATHDGAVVKQPTPAKPKKAAKQRAAKEKPPSFNAQAFLAQRLQELEDGPIKAEGVTLYSDAANDESEAPVVFSGDSEVEMRQLVGELKLDRMPMTMAEYAGVVEYCDHLFEASGKYFSIYEKLRKKNSPILSGLHKSRIDSAKLRYPHWAEPMALFFAEKHDELKAHHRKYQFVEYLGRWWAWSSRHDDNKEAGLETKEEAPSPIQPSL